MMDRLKLVSERFFIPMTVVEGGSGVARLYVSEADQTSQPSYIFVKPRHVLRAPVPNALKIGMVVRTPAGQLYLLGDNGPNDSHRGRLWTSFRGFEPTGRYSWLRRQQVVDPITNTTRDTGAVVEMGPIYAAIEAMDRETSDREMRVFFEQARFITAHEIRPGDTLDGRVVSKVDNLLGLYMGVLT